jgi:hypothetical protein
MRVSFRQGIVQYQVDNQNNQNFLLATDTGVSLLANDKAFIATFAHKDANYLLEERVSINNAWTGPFVAQTQYWLWIDIHAVTGDVTFGATTLPPLVSLNTPNNPQTDQHWYDLTTMQMKVWNGRVWHSVIRLFAGSLIGGAQSFLPIDSASQFGGSQIGLLAPNFSGFIVYDAYGKPLRTSNGTFLTTETTTAVSGSTGNVRYASDLLTATALEPIPAYSVVYFYDFDQIKLATPTLDVTPRIYGIVTQDLQANDVTFVYTDCVITNDHWNWDAMSVPVYADYSGAVTTNQLLDQQSIGYVVARNAIRIDPLVYISQPANDQLSMQQLHDMMQQFGGTLVINGPDSITEGQSGEYSLTFTTSFDGQVIQPAKAHIGCSGNVAHIDGNNVLYVPKPLSEDMQVTLSAFYYYGFNVAEAYKTITLAKQLPISITIQGPSTIYEGNSGSYTTIATYPDGSTSIVSPAYSITQTTVAAINSSNLNVALFDGAGIASNVNQIPDTITATLPLSNGTTLTASMNVTYLRILPVSLTVTGPSSVVAGNTANYVATVKYNNGSTKVVTLSSTWSLTDQIGMSTLGATTGLLTTSNTQYIPSQVTVAASYTEHGVTVSANERVNLLVAGMYGTGPALPSDLAAFIPTLQYRTNGGKAANFAIDDIGMDTFMWYAYPMSYGTASFYDVLSQQFGGWDGAGSPGNYATSTGGPIQVSLESNGVGVVWYVYRTDHSNLGAAAINQWQVT